MYIRYGRCELLSSHSRGEYFRVPLIVLTADRPHELRDVGAPQAIDQIHLYGNHVKWFVEMAPPEHSDEMIRYVEPFVHGRLPLLSSTCRACSFEFPFREPLIPMLDNEQLFQQKEREEGYVQIQQATMSLKAGMNLTCMLSSLR